MHRRKGREGAGGQEREPEITALQHLLASCPSNCSPGWLVVIGFVQQAERHPALLAACCWVHQTDCPRKRPPKALQLTWAGWAAAGAARGWAAGRAAGRGAGAWGGWVAGRAGAAAAADCTRPAPPEQSASSCRRGAGRAGGGPVSISPWDGLLPARRDAKQGELIRKQGQQAAHVFPTFEGYTTATGSGYGSRYTREEPAAGQGSQQGSRTDGEPPWAAQQAAGCSSVGARRPGQADRQARGRRPVWLPAWAVPCCCHSAHAGAPACPLHDPWAHARVRRR